MNEEPPPGLWDGRSRPGFGRITVARIPAPIHSTELGRTTWSKTYEGVCVARWFDIDVSRQNIRDQDFLDLPHLLNPVGNGGRATSLEEAKPAFKRRYAEVKGGRDGRRVVAAQAVRSRRNDA